MSREWPGIAVLISKRFRSAWLPLRADQDTHREQLFEAAQRRRARLLIVDALVELHGVDENHAAEMAGLLAYFRSLHRRLGAHASEAPRRAAVADLASA